MVGDLPVVVVLDHDHTLSDELIYEVHRLVKVVRDAGLVAPPGVAVDGRRRDDRRVPDPGVGTSGRGRAPRPWSGPGTKGYARRSGPP